MLTAFNSCTGLLVELIDNRGIPVLTAGKAAPFCCEFMKYLPNGDSCTNEHFTASRRAIEFGETYIFAAIPVFITLSTHSLVKTKCLAP